MARTFKRDHNEAFVFAIEFGYFSANESAKNYAGYWQYTGSDDLYDHFQRHDDKLNCSVPRQALLDRERVVPMGFPKNFLVRNW